MRFKDNVAYVISYNLRKSQFYSLCYVLVLFEVHLLSTTKIFMATGGQLSYFLLCSISENETDVFNFIYLNSTRLQLLISTNRHDYPLCFNLKCDYNRNP